METVQKCNDMERLLQVLEKQEQLDSLHYLVQKLPDVMTVVQAMEGQLSFIQSMLKDKQALVGIVDEFENSWDSLHFTKEHAESLVKVAHLLPKFVPLLEKLDNTLDFVQSIWKDSKSVDYLVNSIKDVIPMQRGIEIIEKTNDRFAEDKDSCMSFLKMYRLLKDPTVQHCFRYVETMLDVVQTKK